MFPYNSFLDELFDVESRPQTPNRSGRNTCLKNLRLLDAAAGRATFYAAPMNQRAASSCSQEAAPYGQSNLALSLEQAAAIGIAYLAASLGVIEYTQLAAGETLLVAGAGGGVGTAAAHIGRWRGARAIGVDRPISL